MLKTKSHYKPGSFDAIANGCLCPQIDNHYGQGYRTNIGARPQYVINTECPLHGDRKKSS